MVVNLLSAYYLCVCATKGMNANMKLFIKKTITLILIVGMLIFIFCLSVLQIMPLYEDGYNASLIDKMSRLENINESKIVLIGNSNLSFGINSKIIEDELHMPVVNMGLHGNLGNSFHEEMAKININAGDIIVISHTSFSDNDKIDSAILALLTIENHKNLWKLIRTKDIADIMKSTPRYVIHAAKNLIKKTPVAEPYSRDSFNEFGDIATLRTENKFILSDTPKPPEINEVCTDRINDLNELILHNNANLLVAAYPINTGDLRPYAEFEQFKNELENVLNCPVISNYTDYFFDQSLFYDSEYHLTTEGADIRTYLLVEDIKKWKDNNN